MDTQDDLTLDMALALLDEIDTFNGGNVGCWNDNEYKIDDTIVSPRYHVSRSHGFPSSLSDNIVTDGVGYDKLGKYPTHATPAATCGSTNVPREMMDVALIDNGSSSSEDDDQSPKKSKFKTSKKKIKSESFVFIRSTSSRPPRRKGHRQSRREELVHLRTQAAKLEVTLAEMKSKTLQQASVISASPKRGTTSSSTSTMATASLSLGLWEKIAARQLKARKRVEQENSRLRALVKAQHRGARNLRRAIQKRAIVQAIEDGGRFQPQLTELLCDEAVLNDLRASMDDLYNKVDSVVNCSASFGRKYCVKTSPQHGDILNFVDKKLLPFEIWVVANAMCCEWSAPKGSSLAKIVSSNSMERCFLVPYRQDIAIDIKISRVVRKYVEPDRIVFVTNSLVEPSVIGDTPYPSITFREQRWVVLTRGENHVSGATTLVQSHTTITTFAGTIPMSLPREYLDMTTTKWNNAYDLEDTRLDDLFLKFANTTL